MRPNKKPPGRPEEGLRLLDEVFGSASAPPTRGRHNIVLEYQDGEPVFRCADSHAALARDQLEMALDQIFDEELGNDIVLIHCSLAMPDRSWTEDLLIVLLGIVLPIILLLILAWHYLL